ncbi:MAG: hypothetical protein C0622_07395 [Desulfuromonas sp.]|nr:MAG: hypothetical protein C0622_07395 [Desulfuromonas sp.]
MMLKTTLPRFGGQLKIHHSCPDYDAAKQSCRVAISQENPSAAHRQTYCSGDDYDNCPIYLCNALRSSRPCGLDRENLLVNDK